MCDGSKIAIGAYTDLGGCAEACKGISSMFAYGTNDFGTNRCYDDGCSCLCETSATEKGTCDRIDHNGYRLYIYSKGNCHFIRRSFFSNIKCF